MLRVLWCVVCIVLCIVCVVYVLCMWYVLCECVCSDVLITVCWGCVLWVCVVWVCCVGATVASFEITGLHFYMTRNVTMTPTQMSIYFCGLTKFAWYDFSKIIVF